MRFNAPCLRQKRRQTRRKPPKSLQEIKGYTDQNLIRLNPHNAPTLYRDWLHKVDWTKSREKRNE
jgi:hypothetical protein